MKNDGLYTLLNMYEYSKQQNHVNQMAMADLFHKALQHHIERRASEIIKESLFVK